MSGWDNVIDNWYDQALANGQGFKSEEERQAYIAEIGDPLDHPMFADTPEQIARHPLGDAFRLLREEDKTEYELVLMYKDEGNEFMKSKKQQDYKRAIEKYDESLGHVDAMVEDRQKTMKNMTNSQSETGQASKNEEDEDIEEITSPSVLMREEEEELQKNGKIAEGDDGRNVNISKLRSQIISNKAFAHLGLKNYRTCITECDKALGDWPGNMKAHYRKAKALYMIRKFHEVTDAYDAATAAVGLPESIDEGIVMPPDLEALYKNASEEIKKEDALRKENIEKKVMRAKEWISVWDICKQSSVCTAFPQPRDQQQLQLKSVFPHYESGLPRSAQSIRWPMLFLYPQYSELDVVQAASAGDMVAAHLGVMFPELEDLQGEAPVPWDTLKEYQASKLVLYLALDALKPVETLDEWKQGLDEYYGEAGGALDSAKKTSTELGSKSQNTAAYCEVHLGCTLYQVLTCQRHITAGGLTTFLAFPRGNPAHKKFLRDTSKAGYDFFQLDPGTRNPKPKQV